jgi:predicted RNA-binding Zn ribbon-like protein
MTDCASLPTPCTVSDHACIDFVNSSFTDYRGTRGSFDRIGLPEWQEWFLSRHHLHTSSAVAAPWDELAALRASLRQILDKWSLGETLTREDAETLDRRLHDVPFRRQVSVDSSGVRLGEVPLQRDWTWVMAAVTASAVALIEAGDSNRLRTCMNPACSWMFYDKTLNGSRRFCSSTLCASLIRLRRFRQRHGA